MQFAACAIALFCAATLPARQAWARAGASQATSVAPSASPAASPQQPLPAVERASRIQPPPPGYRFPDGQTYVYEVEWRLSNAGTATLRMEPAGAERHPHRAPHSLAFLAL